MTKDHIYQTGKDSSLTLTVENGVDRRDALVHMTGSLYRALNDEFGAAQAAQIAVGMADHYVLVAKTDGFPALPKPKQNVKRSAIHRWAVRRSRWFWYVFGFWLGAGFFNLSDYLAAVLS